MCEDKLCRLEDGYGGEAIERLAAFENMTEALLAEQEKTLGELERLRDAGKTRSVRFRELMGQKMLHQHTLILLRTYGLVERERQAAARQMPR